MNYKRKNIFSYFTNKKMNEIENLINEFIQICKQAQISLKEDDITLEVFHANNKHLNSVNSLNGKMAIYIFYSIQTNEYLKIGKVGVKSNSRFTNQHYNPLSSKSNLAKSLIKNQISDFQNVEEWIRKNTNRYNIKINAKYGKFLLSFFETFLHLKLNPKFEG